MKRYFRSYCKNAQPGLKYHEIGYEHDDSETNEDGLRLQLTDGVHAVEEDIKIDIISVDDETPRVKINRGLQMDFDQVTARIGAEDLSVTDMDSGQFCGDNF